MQTVELRQEITSQQEDPEELDAADQICELSKAFLTNQAMMAEILDAFRARGFQVDDLASLEIFAIKCSQEGRPFAERTLETLARTLAQQRPPRFRVLDHLQTLQETESSTDPVSIAAALGLTRQQVYDALSDLKAIGGIEKVEGRWVPTGLSIDKVNRQARQRKPNAEGVFEALSLFVENGQFDFVVDDVASLTGRATSSFSGIFRKLNAEGIIHGTERLNGRFKWHIDETQLKKYLARQEIAPEGNVEFEEESEETSELVPEAVEDALGDGIPFTTSRALSDSLKNWNIPLNPSIRQSIVFTYAVNGNKPMTMVELVFQVNRVFPFIKESSLRLTQLSMRNEDVLQRCLSPGPPAYYLHEDTFRKAVEMYQVDPTVEGETS